MTNTIADLATQSIRGKPAGEQVASLRNEPDTDSAIRKVADQSCLVRYQVNFDCLHLRCCSIAP